MSSISVSFKSLDELRLEGELDLPEEAVAAVVLCHPHPKMGGTMTAPLLLALRDELLSRRWAVLRFNFRGIGRSEGESSTGELETEDAAGALDLVRERRPDLPVAIAGWSFGGAVAVRVAALDEAVTACVAIAPAVRAQPRITNGLPAPESVGTGRPLLVVCGANDRVVEPADCRSWAGAVETACYVEISGANHFFWARYPKLCRTVGDFLEGAHHPQR
ncbi:MAG: alpha/beta fold hydrolase [Actinomycetota bacterium]|nr:alpha/beta fold hydrolase [Actinomycetota bacterium]